ncbi:MAG TPA: type II toxin-antitoxin system VapC family toxin [Gallionellaceae bacterium]|nr:type II toxin-antitoxin system VapC family toxin [Gallionellaceae bacterium]
MSYMLDTDTCIYLITGREPRKQQNILAKLESLEQGEIVHLSSIVVSELSYGAQKGRWKKTNMALLEQFLLDFRIAVFDEHAAHCCGAIRAALERKGKPIGPMDTLIAAHAVSLDVTLATHNVREFRRVSGLKVENWAAA